MTRDRVRSVGALAVALVGAVALLVFGVRAVIDTGDLVRPTTRHDLALANEAYGCLDRILARRIPSGALVAFDAPNEDGWNQRAIEGSFPRYRVAASDQEADYVVSLSASAQGCRGVQVRIVRAP